MILMGAAANAATIIIGGLLGVVLKKGIPEKINLTLMQGLGLCVMYVGISGAIKGENIVIAVLSIVIAAVIGEALDFDKRLQRLGERLQKKLKVSGSGGSFAEGFVNCTLFVCVGAMAIVGSLQSGLTGNHETLYAKALIDGIVALILASTMGIGVVFGGIAVFVYQAVLTLCASAIAGLVSTPVINEMTCVGSLLIIAISLNMLKLTKIKVSNFILAPFFPILLYMI